ncbi:MULTISPECIES: YtxH domain-containing protein [unclassified Ectothiorhodospira]|uniref:YtxH domain-containing protein n=1 Tax=unclassified Ectothiorhodospira TaxID=2684909 RepID=UPI001EE79DCA|nr:MULTISPECIES: YtxH domain-containing protein [unclassified Ectothiorhodospira]MCG5517299.1 YtxH domain-containing protein [Ectothiorhodospira sp. 9100]MCG5520190.1 YtxH domain-containing protein [Ectothiorhodospira sp. 9905]
MAWWWGAAWLPCLAFGAGAAWVLSDEETRRKLMKAGVDLYSGVAGGVEELKEQMADIKAELTGRRASRGRLMNEIWFSGVEPVHAIRGWGWTTTGRGSCPRIRHWP